MYKRTIWQDHVEGVQEGTDLNAENLNNIEAGTMEANALAALNASYRRYANDVAKETEVYRTKLCSMGGSGEIIVGISDRNNTNYRVSYELASYNTNNVATDIIIYDKSVGQFKARLTNTAATGVAVTFYVSGGMI